MIYLFLLQYLLVTNSKPLPYISHDGLNELSQWKYLGNASVITSIKCTSSVNSANIHPQNTICVYSEMNQIFFQNDNVSIIGKCNIKNKPSKWQCKYLQQTNGIIDDHIVITKCKKCVHLSSNSEIYRSYLIDAHYQNIAVGGDVNVVQYVFFCLYFNLFI